VPFSTWEELDRLRADPPDPVIEGIMLKRLDSAYTSGRAKGPYNRHIGGLTAGGPIVKNKLFIFGDYQITRSDRAVSDLATVPTALMRQGNLSELSRALVSNPSRLRAPETTQPRA